MCEAEDVWSALTKALYQKEDGSNNKAYDALFAPGGWFATHAVAIEKLFGEAASACSDGPEKLAGALYMTCVLDCATIVEPTCLDATPGLKSFVAMMLERPSFAEFKTLAPYCKRD